MKTTISVSVILMFSLTTDMMLYIFCFFPFLICNVLCERVPLSCDQIRSFVDGHNNRRLKVARGLVPGQPAASDMQFMIWDEELAEKAGVWANNGEFSHNPDKSIGSKRWKLIGENIYIYNYYSSDGDKGNIDIEEALNTWFQEHKYFKYAPFFLDFINPFGHYTQMVWSSTNRVGCGISQTTNNKHTKTLIVCDYGPAGNYFEQMPYKSNGAVSQLQCGDGNCNKPYGLHC